MKTAFPYWQYRLAPVFDTARQLLIVESEAGVIASENPVILSAEDPNEKVLRLVEFEIGSLVCGAISRSVFHMAIACGIRVIPFVAGDLDEIVRSWVAGKFIHESYAMPGCRMHRARHSAGPSLQNGQKDRCSRDGQQEKSPVCHAALRRRKRNQNQGR